MSDQPKTWGDMSDAEKGALLLAHHEGKAIQFWAGEPQRWGTTNTPCWDDYHSYRVKPEPKRETVRLYGCGDFGWVPSEITDRSDTHRITFDTIDGEPDCASIRMEKIGGAL